MKILFCTNAFEVVSNGPAKFAHLLLRLQDVYPDYEVRVLTEDVQKPIAGKVYKQNLNIPSVLKPAGMFLRMFQYHTAAMHIRKNGYPFDILIYNNAIIGLWSGIWFKNTIGFINDDNNASANFKAGFLKFKWNKAHVFFITEWLASKTCRKIVANSNYLYNYLKVKYAIAPRKINYLYKAIEIAPFLSPRNNTEPVILFVKNDYQRGGLFILAEALKNLNRPLTFIVAGTPHYVADQLLEKLKGSDVHLQFEGIVPQEKIYELMKSADIFCVPSFKEALGVANLEAMALGCSIVTSNTGGIPEVMDNGKNGWMVEPGNITDLAGAIHEALTFTNLAAEKRLAALTYVKQFNLQALFSNFVNKIIRFE